MSCRLSHAGFAAAAFVLAGSVRAQSGDVDFTSHIDQDMAGSDGHDLLAVDIDGDGDVDLISTSKTGEVGIRRNDGSGDFGQDDPFDAGVLAFGVGAGDWNGDGFVDLAVTDGTHDGTSVEIWLNDPSDPGAFSKGTTLHGGKFPVDAVGGDFDEDGDADLAVADNVLYGLTIFLGEGDGTFGAPAHVPGVVTMYSLDMEMGDLDRDGHLDLVVSHYYGVSVFFGQGDGTFPVRWDGVASALMQGVAIGDLDRDGWPDLVAVASYTDDLVIALNLGDRSFTTIGTITASPWPDEVAVADFDQDGNPDVAVAMRDSDAAVVFAGHGDGTLHAPQPFAAGEQPVDVVAADFSGDTRPDLGVLCRNLGDTAILSLLRNQSPDAAWDNRGFALAGSGGRPHLHGTGTPSPNQAITFTLTQARASSPAFAIWGLSELDAVFMGGTLVPDLDGILYAGTTAVDGSLALTATLPADTPVGVELFVQEWIVDAAAPRNLAASNGLRIVTQ